MLDISVIVELITGVGFPIALVVVLLWFIFKLQAESTAREEKLYSVISTFGTNLNEVAITLTKVSDALTALTDRVVQIENKIDGK